MRNAELAGRSAEFAPGFDEASPFVEAGDAVVAIAVSNEKRAVGQERNVGRHVEVTVVSARVPKEPAQRHDELLAVSCEFVDLMHVPVDDPDVRRIVRIDPNRMTETEQVGPL